MESLLDKASSVVNQAKDAVAASVETAKSTVEAAKTEASSTVSQARDTVEAAKTEASSTVNQAKETAESAKDEASSAPQKLTDSLRTQVKDAVDGAVSRGIDGAKSLLQSLEEKKEKVSSKLLGAVKNTAAGAGGSSSADSAASRDLPVSTDNQPLLASGQRGEESTPWWKNCCGLIDLLQASLR